MPTLTTAHVRALLTHPAPPCVSVYLPTHRNESDRREDPVRYKTLVRQVEDRLRADHPGDRAAAIARKFNDFADDAAFWSDPADGLAAFAADDFFVAHRLPRSVAERVVVADSFHLKPLLRITQSADRFQVLGVTRTEAFLFEGDRYGLRRIPTAGRVPSFDEAVGTEVTEPSREKLTVGGRSASTGHYSSGGGGRKDELQVDAEKFFREVDRAVLENVSKRSELPLVLVGLAANQAEFRKHSHNPHLLPDGVAGDPGAMTPEKVRAEVWKVVEPRYLARLARLTEDYGTAASRGKGAYLVADVARACRDGRVGTLLVDADTTLPGTVDVTTGEVKFGDGGDDLLDDMAELTLKTGGDVVVVPHDKMPTETGLAAIYRF